MSELLNRFFCISAVIVVSILINTPVLRLQSPQTHLLHPHWEATCNLTFVWKAFNINQIFEIFFAIISPTNKQEKEALQMCSSTVPVETLAVFAKLLCAVICGAGD